MPTDETANIAVLIDAENVDPAYAEHIFTYAHSLGNVSIREIYGSGISLNEWADPILTNSIHTNFTLRPNRYKNSSDICLVIGAMEILAATRNGGRGAVDAVVIVSSDSDFSSLAVHLRSAGLDVIGMGEAGRCNPMWPRACTDFIGLETKTPLMRRRDDIPAEHGPAAGYAEPAAQKNAPAQKAEQLAEQNRKKEADNKKEPEDRKEQKKAEPEKEKKKKEVIKITTTHKDRVEIIRGLITEQIESHDGRVRSGDLFRAIGTNPEYKYDQVRSRRNPMEYLRKQYGTWFVFEPGDNGSSWISLKSAPQAGEGAEASTEAASEAAEGVAAAEEAIETVAGEAAAAVAEQTVEAASEPVIGEATEAGTEAADEKGAEAASEAVSGQAAEAAAEPAVKPAAKPAAKKAAAGKKTADDRGKQGAKKEKKNTKKTEEPAAEAEPVSVLRKQLIDAGIPEKDAGNVEEILSHCRHLRDSYNHLRQAFGNETGKQYQQMIKDANIQFGNTVQ